MKEIDAGKTCIVEFEISLFCEKVIVCIAPSTDVLKEFFNDLELSTADSSKLGLSFGATHKDGSYRRVIWLRKWDITTFIHEAYHLTKYVLDYAGVECHETGAYLIEFVCSETIKALPETKQL